MEWIRNNRTAKWRGNTVVEFLSKANLLFFCIFSPMNVHVVIILIMWCPYVPNRLNKYLHIPVSEPLFCQRKCTVVLNVHILAFVFCQAKMEQKMKHNASLLSCSLGGAPTLRFQLYVFLVEKEVNYLNVFLHVS